jgi:hypothetical protein
MKKKIKLSTLFIFSVLSIFILLVIFFVSISLHSVNKIGNYSVSVFKQTIKEDNSIFFTETTYRATREYSNYFDSISDLSYIISKRVESVLEKSKDYPDKGQDLLKKIDDGKFYNYTKNNRLIALYWGDKEKLKAVNSELKALINLLPLLKTVYIRNKNYISDIWIVSLNDFSLSYPQFNLNKYLPKMDILKKDMQKVIKACIEKKKPFWTHPTIQLVTGREVIFNITPMFDKNNKLKGFVSISLRLNDLLNVMLSTHFLKSLEGFIPKNDNIPPEIEGFIFILDRNGNIIGFPKEHCKQFNISYSKLKPGYYYETNEYSLMNSKNESVNLKPSFI